MKSHNRMFIDRVAYTTAVDALLNCGSIRGILCLDCINYYYYFYFLIRWVHIDFPEKERNVYYLVGTCFYDINVTRSMFGLKNL